MPRWAKISLGIVVAILVVLVLTVVGLKWYDGEFSSSGTTFGLGNGSYGTSPMVEVGLGVRAGVAQDSYKTMANENIVSTPASLPALPAERLIIKTGEMTLVVTDVPATVKNIVAYAEKNGGFVVVNQIYKNGLIPYGEVTVRIPSKAFEGGMLEVKALGDVQRENVVGQDVTEEYVDLGARLNNLQATEKQFLAIMAKATKITDILAVQRELSQVRGEIESMQGRMKYLKTSADMSSLTVYLSTDPSVLPTIEDSNEWKPLAVLKSAARGLIAVGKGLANAVIYIAVFIPLWILIALIVWGIRALARRRRARAEGVNFKR